MRSNMLITVFRSLVAGALVAGTAHAIETPRFQALVAPYEAIRQVLLHDGLEGIDENAASIRNQAETQLAEPNQPGDGTADPCGKCQAALVEIIAAASDLERATTLTSAREAFGKLSQPMIRLRETVAGERPVVVYCSMAKKSWLQPPGEIGNPYYGQSMARCGEVASK